MSASTLSPKATISEMQARACQRAHAERVHIFAVPGRAGHYTTKSKSDPGERYSLVVAASGDVACSCTGYSYRKVCKHAEALANRLAREATKPAHQPARPLCGCDLYDLRPGETCTRCGTIG